MDCIFCKIAKGEIPSKKFYEDEDILGFADISPQAPVHIIFIPKKHIASSMDDITSENSDIIGKIMVAIAKTAKEQDLVNGYRIVNNCGKDACQSVQHIHFHLLGGKQMSARME